MRTRGWLAAAGAGLLAASALRAEPAAAPAASFTVGWWNIESFGESDRYIGDRHVDRAMKPPGEIYSVVAVLKRLHPDILGVAEIVRTPDDRNLKLLQRLLREAGLDYPSVSVVHGEDRRIEIALFSRFPIRAEEPFTEDTFPATLTDRATGQRTRAAFRVGRGFLNDRIEVAPGQFVQVMAAHLKSRRVEHDVEGDEPGESGDAYVRRREAGFLRQHIDAFVAAHPHDDLVVMGDMNDLSTSRALRPLLGSAREPSPVRDLPLTDRFGDWWTECYFPPKSYDRIDYMFATPGLFARYAPQESFVFRPADGDGPELNPSVASDHRPLLARFALPAK